MWFILHMLAAEQETTSGVRLNLLTTYSHRAIELCGLEGTFEGHPVHPLCNEQGHPQLDQVAQTLTQPEPDRVSEERTYFVKDYKIFSYNINGSILS